MSDAIQDLITALQNNKIAPDGHAEPVRIPIEKFIAALNEIESSIAGGPYLPLAGGTMTGSMVADGIADANVDSFGGINVTSSAAPANGMALAGVNTPGIYTNGTLRWSFVPTGGSLQGASGGPEIANFSASSTAPTLIPRNTSANTGFGAAAAGDISAICGGSEIARFLSTGIALGSGIGTGAALGDYEVGTWTPVDVSGASLALTVTSATYVKVGNLVIACTRLAYPANASATVADLGGFPFTSGDVSSSGIRVGSLGGISALMGTAATDVIFINASGNMTNANLSNAGIFMGFAYHT